MCAVPGPTGFCLVAGAHRDSGHSLSFPPRPCGPVIDGTQWTSVIRLTFRLELPHILIGFIAFAIAIFFAVTAYAIWYYLTVTRTGLPLFLAVSLLIKSLPRKTPCKQS